MKNEYSSFLEYKIKTQVQVTKGLATSIVLTYQEAQSIIGEIDALQTYGDAPLLEAHEAEAIGALIDFAVDESKCDVDSIQINKDIEICRLFLKNHPLPEEKEEPADQIQALIQKVKKYGFVDVSLAELEEAYAEWKEEDE